MRWIDIASSRKVIYVSIAFLVIGFFMHEAFKANLAVRYMSYAFMSLALFGFLVRGIVLITSNRPDNGHF